MSDLRYNPLMPILDHFGWIAPFYDRLASPPDRSIWRELLRLPITGRLLDVGGGTGRLSGCLTGDARGVVLADASWKMAREAYAKPGLLPLVTEGEGLPFASASFSRVMMVDALHHVRDQQQCVTEMLRVLVPGGRLVIVEPDLRQGAIKVVAVLEKLLLMRSHILAPQAIRALFAGAAVNVEMRTLGSSVILLVDKATG